METSKYLPAGSIIADKYVVIEVLGEDDFEILYLVRDIDRKGSFFVLKELFLETFSFREQNFVSTVVEARAVFNKRKKQIVEEVNEEKFSKDSHKVRVFGYEEDNDTIYTIMEFSNNASLEKYLQFTPKNTKNLPTLKELVGEEQKSLRSKIPFILKIFLLLTLLGIALFYAYQFFQNNETQDEVSAFSEEVSTEEVPALQDRVQSVKKMPKVESVEPKVLGVQSVNSIVTKERDILAQEKKIAPISMLVPISVPKKVEVNNTVKSELMPKTERVTKVDEVMVEEVEIIETQKSPEPEPVLEKVSTKSAVKTFLDAYINAIAKQSATESLKYYAASVKQYYQFKKPSHKTILKSKEKYNKKWKNRNFKITNFKILKEYNKNNVDYIDLKTTTVWTIKNKQGKKLSGESRGVMTLKVLENGFKIVSIK